MEEKMPQDNKTGEGKGGVSRREFLAYAAGSAIAFIGVVEGLAALGGSLSPAFAPKKLGEWVKLGRVDTFKPEQPQKVDFTLFIQDGWMETTSAKSVWVVRHEDGNFNVFNSRCTHLGCIVDWKTGSRGLAFYSPCHAGVFNLEGTVVTGPPPRSLDKLEWKVEGGELSCRYLDFVVGIPEKKPV